MNDIESTNMSLTMDDNTSTSHVTPTSDHSDVPGLERHVVSDLVLLEVELDGVVDADGGVGVTDRAAVVGRDVRDTTRTEGDLADFEELVGGLLGGDAVDGESALDVVEDTEVLARLLERDDI